MGDPLWRNEASMTSSTASSAARKNCTLAPKHAIIEHKHGQNGNGPAIGVRHWKS